MSGQPSSLSSVLRDYRALPAISGRSFLPVSMLGRLPVAMAPVAILTHVAATTGDLAAAGLATTAVAAGTALGSPAVGLLADRFGQRPALLAAVAANTMALVFLALVPGLGSTQRLVLCALVGASLPQVSGMSRARWIALTRSRLNTALAFEGTADELSFVLGPALAGVLATAWSTCAALLVAAALALLASGAFAVHPTHRALSRLVQLGSTGAVRPIDGPPVLPALRLLRVLAGPLAGLAAMGVLFAAVETALTAYCRSAGQPSSGGLLYALMAVGSALTATLMPVIAARFTARARLIASSLGLVLGVVLMLGATTLGTVPAGAAALVTGLSVGPLLITLNEIAAQQVSAQQSASAMGFLSSGVVCGIAAGALAAGPAAQSVGPAGAFVVALAATLVMTVISLTRRAQR